MNTAERSACFNRPSRDKPRQLNVLQSSQRQRIERELDWVNSDHANSTGAGVCPRTNSPQAAQEQSVCEQALGSCPSWTGSVFVVEMERMKVWPGHHSQSLIMVLITKIECVNLYVVQFLRASFLITNNRD